MLPVTLLAAQSVAALLTASTGVSAEIQELAVESQLAIPAIPSNQIYLSSAPASAADLQQELGYPRISIFSSKVKNTQVEKFRSFSGSAVVTAEIAITSNLINEVDTYIHFYLEAIANVLQRNRGDWGNGICFFGTYDSEIQPPKTGMGGFVQIARINFEVGVSRS